MKHIAFMLAATTIAAPCPAQTTHMMMPEGSWDMTIGLGAASAPETEGSSKRSVFVSPLVSAQFSNGVFIDMNTVGIHLSETPEYRYGLQFAPTISRVQVRTADGLEAKRRFTPEVGGFFHYPVAHGVGLNTSLMYGGSSDHRGLRLTLGGHVGMPVAEHHYVSLSAEATLANRSSLQADFSVQEQEGVAGYMATSGLRDTSLTASWVWELSTKYTLRTMLRWNQLRGSAAASPRIEQARGIVSISAVSYSF